MQTWQTQSSFSGPKSYRDFRGTGPLFGPSPCWDAPSRKRNEKKTVYAPVEINYLNQWLIKSFSIYTLDMAVSLLR